MIKLSTKAHQWVNGLGALLFPPVCLFCKQPLSADALFSDSDGSAFDPANTAGLCCSACVQAIHIWSHQCCVRCGTGLPAAMSPGPCGHCLTHPPAQAETYSLYDYHGPVRDALLEWKLQGREAAVRWLLQAAMPRLSEMIKSDDLLLPVPMPISRMRQHGQHHAANMCHWLADEIACDWDWRVLRRIGEQPRQSALSGSARRKNLRKAFALAADYGQRWRQKSSSSISVWIVDDILTTGSTLHFAAKTSLRLGMTVKVLSLARTSYKG
ncbi:MAG: ComF family protein [Mariprofundus sp.]|nr:ComF family protein [Mariprofundus sp.]